MNFVAQSPKKAKRKKPPRKAAPLPERPPVPEISAEPALCFVGESAHRLFGLSPADRLRRQFAREGVSKEIKPEEAASYAGPIIVIRADAAIDQPLIPILAKRPSFALLEDGSERQPIAANVRGKDAARLIAHFSGDGELPELLARAPSELDAAFWKGLRKKETPYAMQVRDEAAAAWRIFMGTYKGATDLITKHVWPVPAFHATQYLAPRGISPNMVTLVGAICTVLAFWLFWRGDYWPGILAAWAMTFLDTVDGKLARTTLTSSKWGDVFDHGIDLVHPPFWYAAWAAGLGVVGLALPEHVFWWTLIAILGGYVLQRAIEGISIAKFGLEIHIWRPIDTFFRQITARRNPNLILLTLSLLIGRPDWGLIAVASWTAVCLILHGIQIGQALAASRAGPLESWMAKR
jgi:phosphatidylglycerophosphate synthase